MLEIWLYSLISVFIVSLVSLIGIVSISINTNKLSTIIIYFVSFSAGALFGDTFIHLIPEAYEMSSGISVAVYVLIGILIFFILEKIIHWQHCHMPITSHHVHHFAYMNLIGDGLHNLIDGLIIGASYLASIPIGIATTVAVVLHEIPQEIGDFGVLIYSGFSKAKAVFMNFLSALTAVIGTAIALIISQYVPNIQSILVPIAAGGFIYIAGSDLIPELHKETKISKSLIQLGAFILGIAIMFLLLLIE